jgi:26S proteasome regulatory subunit N7
VNRQKTTRKRREKKRKERKEKKEKKTKTKAKKSHLALKSSFEEQTKSIKMLIVLEADVPRVPDLSIAQLKFQLQLDGSKAKADDKAKLMEEIKKHNMVDYYKNVVVKDLGWPEDKKLVSEMSVKREARLAELQEKIATAEKNEGETEIKEAMLAKAEYLVEVGDKKGAIETTEKALEKTVGAGNRLDVVFLNIRVGLFFMDHAVIGENMDKAKQMIEEGGDWDRRNRLKVYEGLYAISVRDFARGAKLFLDTVSTFTSYELMDYKEFVKYTVFASMIALERRELMEKVIRASEIQEVLHECPDVKKYLMSLYDCHYGDFFAHLAMVEQQMKRDRYLNPHYAFYIREMKVRAFAQLLASYRSLTLAYMAESFNVTEEYMDRELSRLIADGRLHCKIDKVRGIVMTNRPDSKNAQYQATIKQGDILLNRVQKLSRVINI